MENRRISHRLPARAKANTDPHMHRSGHFKPPPLTITTDETQESFCFLREPLFPGLTVLKLQEKLRGLGLAVEDNGSLTYMPPKSYLKVKGKKKKHSIYFEKSA